MASRKPYDSDEEGDAIPLQHQRQFGSGLHRRPIAFVPAVSGSSATSENRSDAATASVADLYLDIVLGKESGSTTPDVAPPQVCEVCQLPPDGESLESTAGKQKLKKHETSLAHQVCLAHSHPPSALDRRRLGMSVLQSQGWDPDSRVGLGAQKQGSQYPIKVKEKNDTLGIGVRVPKNLERFKKEKVQKADAGKARQMAAEDKRRRERLQREFYGNGELEKYLGR
ncbi:hypothetical protein JX265_000173 [Neoarthrinium moseri]|uniref:G-patch domain-containing protein n=1 Tax=Neoarthrinium moseri TaxID=1658444 RepID=A0A9P9WY17_9PEZI|nr:hypothetical protein JX265_000173 [Neoarthrinium moseri]